MANWTQDEVAVLMKNLHLSTVDIVEVYNRTKGVTSRSYDAIQKKVKEARELYNDRALDDTRQQVAESLVQEPVFNIVAVPAGEDPLMVPTNEVETQVAQWLADAAATYKGRAAPPVDSKYVSLVILLSDNHFGKKTPEFNLEVARQRTLSMCTEIAASHRATPIDEIVLVLAGDEVEGEDIYANQNGGLECPVIFQAKAACEAYWELALNLRETFQCQVRMQTCPGNHGRMSKTADTRSNWDNVVYMMLAQLAEQNPEAGISMDLNFDDFTVFPVKGKNLMAYHYGTKHLGTPAMQVKFAGWILKHNVELLMHGHWHQWGVETYLGRPMVANGCMCGPDDLAKSMAKEEPPRQAYFFVERDKPIRLFGFVEW